jgi:hypothetical protein
VDLSTDPFGVCGGQKDNEREDSFSEQFDYPLSVSFPQCTILTLRSTNVLAADGTFKYNNPLSIRSPSKQMPE